MRVEIWSDVICPWCYIGKRRFEAALGRFEHRDEVDVVWRSYELQPGAPAERTGDMASHLARKYGLSEERAHAAMANITDQAAGEGLAFRYDETRPGNTFDAHRLLHLAADRGIQERVKERFFAAYFTEGQPVGNRDTLARLATEAGLDPGDVDDVLAGDAYADAVRGDEAAANELGITGVPCFVVDGRFAIPGAQDPETILRILERAWDRRPQPMVQVVAGGGDSRTDEA